MLGSTPFGSLDIHTDVVNLSELMVELTGDVDVFAGGTETTSTSLEWAMVDVEDSDLSSASAATSLGSTLASEPWLSSNASVSAPVVPTFTKGMLSTSAYIFTKPLSVSRFQVLKSNLMVGDPPMSLQGCVEDSDLSSASAATSLGSTPASEPWLSSNASVSAPVVPTFTKGMLSTSAC
ncbi:hypothetical protein RHGRI_034961 [Rhododendron griersonianum]|uniref:Uncharacterized protein n=1 Tax=Rhododendron griersonianum TaxID=479676 RepID=A0AAV6I8S2_9ERIC|nr:hypothetical protein RHGRI_034961 [Rhododendron griersonianum]